MRETTLDALDRGRNDRQTVAPFLRVEERIHFVVRAAETNRARIVARRSLRVIRGCPGSSQACDDLLDEPLLDIACNLVRVVYTHGSRILGDAQRFDAG